MVRVYMTQDLAPQVGGKFINIRVPGLNRNNMGAEAFRYQNRLFTLTIRAFLRKILAETANLERMITGLINQYTQDPEGNKDAGGQNVTATGNVGDGEKVYWIVSAGHPPAGPCPWCLWISSSFSGGMPIEKARRLANDPRHVALHMNSRVHNPVSHCHCRIIPFKQVSSNDRKDIAKSETKLPLPPAVKDQISNGLTGAAKGMFATAMEEAGRQLEAEGAQQAQQLRTGSGI